ncbi:transposase domain-containing protein [Paracoccus aminovorans]|uniref:transposase domain-containing protein n=1 Tax=Paracoccus aminovorans TaxID=34004 RepID=UPI0018D4EF0C
MRVSVVQLLGSRAFHELALGKILPLRPRYLADVLQRMVGDHPVNRLDELLPWSWKAGNPVKN